MYVIMYQYFSISIGDSKWHYFNEGQGWKHQVRPPAETAGELSLQVQADQIENIKKILTRRKETIFSSNGSSLQEIPVWETTNRLRYWWHAKQERKGVKALVSNAMKALDAAVANVTDLEQQAVVKRFLKDHFFTNLTQQGVCARMRTDVFDRDVLKGGHIEKLLAPEIAEKREKLKNAACSNADKSLDMKRTALSAALYALRNDQVIFSKNLGVPLKIIGSGGSGGARVGHALNSKKVTVIKPGDEGPYGANTPSWLSWIKQFFLSPRKCLLWQSEPRAEEASSRLAEVFAFGNTPYTRTEEITAYTFRGTSRKECSQQMFMGVGKVQTLGEYLGISESWHSIPRFLRSCLADRLSKRADGPARAEYPHANSWWKRCIRFLFEKLLFSAKPLPPIDDVLLIMAGLMKYLSGDIDTHFDNMLVVKLPKEAFTAGGFLEKYFKGEATEQETRDFFDKEENLDHLLCHLFESAQLTNGDRIAIVNHDGGAAFINSHPSSSFWGLDNYLSGRHRFLFETHPVFAKPFPNEVQRRMEGKDEVMRNFLMENALRELIGVLGIDVRVYRNFRKKHVNRELFKKYIFQGDKSDLEKLTRCLLQVKMEDPIISASYYPYYDRQFRGDLKRIHGMTKIGMDQYRFLIQHLADKPDAPMRELFLHIDEKDFDVKQIENSERVKQFDEMIKTFAQRSVSNNLDEIPKDCEFEYLKKSVTELAMGDFINAP